MDSPREIFYHDDVIKWKLFPRYWPFGRGAVNSPHKGLWRGALMFCLICVWMNGWVNNREAGDLRRYRAHYEVTLIITIHWYQHVSGNYRIGFKGVFILTICHLFVYHLGFFFPCLWFQTAGCTKYNAQRYWRNHDDVIKWKHFPRYWPFVWGIHRSPVNSPHKGQWRGALMFTLICAWISGWVDNRKAGDLIRNRAHYDVSVMISDQTILPSQCYQVSTHRKQHHGFAFAFENQINTDKTIFESWNKYIHPTFLTF